VAETRAWYETRKKFRNSPDMLARAAKIDRNLRRWANDHPRLVVTGGPYEQCGRVDLGKTTWSRFQPVTQPLTDEDCERLILPASTIAMPDFPDDVIPGYLLAMEMSGLIEEDPGFEDFGRGICKTHVYFAQAAFSGLIKIGISEDVPTRISGLRTASSEPIMLLHSVPANALFEAYLHGLFEPLHSHGEWFYPHWSLFSAIAGLET
jgi:hypothetical protein